LPRGRRPKSTVSAAKAARCNGSAWRSPTGTGIPRTDDDAQRKPIGIAPHGALNEPLHRAKHHNVLLGLLKRIRDQGVLVGLSAHDPTLIEESESCG
jgi:hypothetical protein